MKNIPLFYFLIAILAMNVPAAAQNKPDNASEKFKKYINKVVQRVHKAEDPARKRAILNTSFDKMLESFDRVKKMERVSGSDEKAISRLENMIREKKNELNGRDGYVKVSDGALTNFAQYVQQDLEQAHTEVTISLTVLLLILIILLLL